jgi:hypothetical protein
MARFPRALIEAAKRAARDPRVRAKAAEIVQKEVKPRAKEAWRQAKPKLDAAKTDLKNISRETDPRKNPREFASKLKQRFFNRKSSASG